ncbi:hypothetical protein G5C41_02275 [Burkholderia pseudomallei]|uniref:hypothetical protein n=1 Tax=Burkholderia TaxID=32008 RepID=UPI0003A1F019|nr:MULTISPECIES: hypothetical protein [Burkholderia]MBD2936251.1 hypothetical protein [Burkholderia pseudomallei]MBD2960082.1 hypothetical protein [Burkholderia pseudomallei]VBE90337.1 Uncharacterised protein [Burkholderia pseudomallei]VBY49796.1 Uncharacterised protein [Burkholderia pseudomallei]VBY72747.1 Uncharacterised protein [Burkholderia pseudomallei]
MQQLNERLKAATRAFEDARARLERTRIAYTNGPGKRYAETINNAGTLPAQTAEYQRAHEEAKATLGAAMLQSGGQVTPEVKAALSARRDAEDLIEQFTELEKHAERTRKRAHLDASKAAREYVDAYEHASQCWAEMNVLSALVECGERIARAMAVVPAAERLVPYAITTGTHETICKDRMLNELDRLRDIFREDDRLPYQNVIGKLELGALEVGEILSAAGIIKVSEELRADAS